MGRAVQAAAATPQQPFPNASHGRLPRPLGRSQTRQRPARPEAQGWGRPHPGAQGRLREAASKRGVHPSTWVGRKPPPGIAARGGEPAVSTAPSPGRPGARGGACPAPAPSGVERHTCWLERSARRGDQRHLNREGSKTVRNDTILCEGNTQDPPKSCIRKNEHTQQSCRTEPGHLHPRAAADPKGTGDSAREKPTSGGSGRRGRVCTRNHTGRRGEPLWFRTRRCTSPRPQTWAGKGGVL